MDCDKTQKRLNDTRLFNMRLHEAGMLALGEGNGMLAAGNQQARGMKRKVD